MKKHSIPEFMKYIAFVVLFSFYALSGMAQTEIIIPADTLHWEKVSCGNWQTSGDSLIVDGTDYRIAGVVETKDFFDLSNSEVYIKWKINSAGQFMAASLLAGGYMLGTLATTDHSCCNSIVISDNTWYYTQVKFHSDTSFTAIRSTDDFYDNGGTFFDSLRQKITPKRWMLGIKNGKIKTMLHDNYGGDACSFTVGKVILKNAIKLSPSSIIDTKLFDFEEGKIPPEMSPDTNSTWSIADTGFQSDKSLFIEQSPGHSSWIEMNVTGATKVSFDARYISGYSWNAIMSASFAIDTLNMVTFDRSNKGCWHHFEWLIPNPYSRYNLRWYSSYSGSYPQNNSKLWIDNIKIYYSIATGIISHKNTDIALVQSFPNPFSENTVIEYTILKPSFVRIAIFNLMGQRIKILDSGKKAAGTCRVQWNASGISPGTYFVKITTDNGFSIKKLILER